MTTPWDARSGIGDYTRALMRHLADHCAIDVFVEAGREGGDWFGWTTRSVETLVPREYDQVLYQIGNERQHAFMARKVRELGGCVVLHDWVLFDLALAAYPALERGGWKGHALALREGGAQQARRYLDTWLARRRAKREVTAWPAKAELDAARGPFVAGWHAAEERGRWTSDFGGLLCEPQARRARIVLRGPRGRSIEVLVDGARERLHACSGGEDELEIAREPFARIDLLVAGVEVTAEQRAHGDARRLGVFVTRIELDGRELDLAQRCDFVVRTPSLADARFALPLNRSIVRFADAFIVHSEHVKRLILEDRNAPTPVGVVPHGADAHWSDADRRVERAELALPPSFADAFVLTSFGGVQVHKRIDVELRALAIARRERPDVRLILIGGEDASCDARGLVRRLALEDAVHFTGHVDEVLARRYIRAGDLALQLRGPSSGGTSGGVFQSLGCGRGVIASDFAEQRELPPSCVLRVAHGEREVDELARLIVELRDAPARRAELERAAREFVERECAWSLVARRYFELLKRIPPPRTARKSLLAMRVRQGVRDQARERAS